MIKLKKLFYYFFFGVSVIKNIYSEKRTREKTRFISHRKINLTFFFFFR